MLPDGGLRHLHQHRCILTRCYITLLKLYTIVVSIFFSIIPIEPQPQCIPYTPYITPLIPVVSIFHCPYISPYNHCRNETEDFCLSDTLFPLHDGLCKLLCLARKLRFPPAREAFNRGYSKGFRLDFGHLWLGAQSQETGSTHTLAHVPLAQHPQPGAAPPRPVAPAKNATGPQCFQLGLRFPTACRISAGTSTT